jgi:hypothetical protein
MADAVNVASGGAAGAGAAGAGGGGAVAPLAAPTDADFAAATEAIKVAGAQPGMIKSGHTVRAGCYLCGHTDTLSRFIKEGAHGSRCTAYGAKFPGQHAGVCRQWLGGGRAAQDRPRFRQGPPGTCAQPVVLGGRGRPRPCAAPGTATGGSRTGPGPGSPCGGRGGVGRGPGVRGGRHSAHARVDRPDGVSQARALRREDACRQLRHHLSPFARHVTNGPTAPVTPDTMRSWAVGFVLAVPGWPRDTPSRWLWA